MTLTHFVHDNKCTYYSFSLKSQLFLSTSHSLSIIQKSFHPFSPSFFYGFDLSVKISSVSLLEIHFSPTERPTFLLFFIQVSPAVSLLVPFLLFQLVNSTAPSYPQQPNAAPLLPKQSCVFHVFASPALVQMDRHNKQPMNQ